MGRFILALLPTCIPLIVYLIIGLSRSSRPKGPSDYFIYGQQVSASDYANTSVGYALQMAAMLLFATWAAQYGIGALWTPLFWGLGFYLLVKLLPNFLAYHSHATTMHDYLGRTFGHSRALQRLAACATVVGLMGTLMTEVDYTVQLYAPVFPTAHGQELLGVFFLVFGLFYIVLNGYKAEVNTERVQIPIAYACLWAVLLLMLPRVWSYSGVYSYVVIFGLLLFTAGMLFVGKLCLTWKVAKRDVQILIPCFAVIALVGVTIFAIRTPGGHHNSVLSRPLNEQLTAQGALAIFSLFIANALWMPVDLSTWQRIASVRGSNGDLLGSLQRGTWRTLFESPASWILGAALGLSINAGGFLSPTADVNTILPEFANSVMTASQLNHSVSATVLYWLLLIASVTIMLSTIHCMISAVSFTVYQDFGAEFGKHSLLRARWWTAVVIVLGAVAYHELRSYFAANLPTLVYGAYSAQLSLIFVAILGLLKERLDKRAAIASVCFGLTGTVVSVIVAIKVGTQSSAVLPPIFAVFSSMVGYILFFRRPGSKAANTPESSAQ